MGHRISGMKVLLGVGLVIATASTGLAGPVATLTLVNGDGGGDPFNTTYFTLSNASTDGISITGTSLTIGDENYVFDNVYLDREQFLGGDGTQTADLLVGSRNDDNSGPGVFTYAFTNLTPSVSFRGMFDIDQLLTFQADARQVLFNNGAAPNAVWSVNFSDGSVGQLTLPDGSATQDSYTFTVTPAPGAMLLLPAALLARRRNR